MKTQNQRIAELERQVKLLEQELVQIKSQSFIVSVNQTMQPHCTCSPTLQNPQSFYLNAGVLTCGQCHKAKYSFEPYTTTGTATEITKEIQINKNCDGGTRHNYNEIEQTKT